MTKWAMVLACAALPACGASRGAAGAPPAAMSPLPATASVAEPEGWGGEYDPNSARPNYLWENYTRQGAYMGAAAIWTIQQFNAEPLQVQGTPIGLDFHDGYGFGVRAGYRLSRWFAAEAFGELDFGNKVEVDVGPFTANLDDIDIWSGGLQFKTFLLHGEFQPYLLVGGGYTHIDFEGDSDEDLFARGGAGLVWHVDEATMLFIEGNYNAGSEIDDIADLNRTDVSIGLLFWF